MTEILRFIFETLTGECTLFENIIMDKIFLYIVGSIALGVAWVTTRQLYEYDIISGSIVGKIAHWTIRTIVFFVVFYIGCLCVNVWNFLVVYWLPCLIGLLVVIALSLIIRYFYGPI